MPAEYVGYARLWESFGWTVHDWDETQLVNVSVSFETAAVLKSIADHGVSVGGGIESVGRQVQTADVFGYELVRNFGGVYANCDIEPLADLGQVLDGVDGFVVSETPSHLSNALMGAVAGHWFYEDVCVHLPPRFWERRWAAMTESTCPWLLTDRWRANGERPARLEPVPFFPVEFGDELTADRSDRSGFLVDHRWGHRHPELLEVNG
jgi:hypothetical protein